MRLVSEMSKLKMAYTCFVVYKTYSRVFFVYYQFKIFLLYLHSYKAFIPLVFSVLLFFLASEPSTLILFLSSLLSSVKGLVITGSQLLHFNDSLLNQNNFEVQG